MSNPDFQIKTKVVVGYIVTTLLSVAVAIYVYNKITTIVDYNNDETNHIYEKSTLTGRTITSLYAVEYYGNRLLQYYTNQGIIDYNKALSELQSNIDSLSTLLPDNGQVSKLKELLEKKKINTQKLITIYQSMRGSDIAGSAINQIANLKDTTVLTTVKRTVVRDTIQNIKPQKDNFWKRLGNVFKPNRGDTIPNIISSQRVDTMIVLPYVNDSLVAQLAKIQADFHTNRLSSNRVIARNTQQLIATEKQISTQISSLLTELANEATLNSLEDLKLKRETLRQAGVFIAIVAIFAILLIVLFLALIFRDINKSVRYKQELERARRRAEELMESRHKMLLGISHDIKAPLSSIVGYLDLMSDSSDSKVNNYAQSMKLSSSYITALLANLLEFAKQEQGKSKPNMSTFDFDEMMEEIRRLFKPLAAEKELTLKVCGSGVGLIESDAIKIHQIVMNLVSNSLKFTEKGGVEVMYNFTDKRLNIVVTDSGVGISQENKRMIFDEFSRVRSNVEGNGLGLSVVRGSVEILSGEISLESTLGKGSRFTISVPAVQIPQPATTKQAKHNILIVDDDTLQLKMTAEMVAAVGHIPFTASTMTEVRKNLSRHDIDLIITDLNMGDFSGYELLRNVQNDGYCMPVVVASASGSVNEDELKKIGFRNLIHKPFSINQLRAIIISDIDYNLDSLFEMFGDKEAVDEIVTLFITATSDNLKSLEEYWNSGQLKDIKQLCHKMLPMFSQLGIIRVASLLREVDSGSNITKEKIDKIIIGSQKVLIQLNLSQNK